MNHPTDPDNHVYILRVWRGEWPNSAWFASLENPRTGKRIGFENLERLFVYLIEQIEREAKIKLEEKA